jgi:outer membrane scaffolding protein for murein synthesis (MipA/OmpV family)
MSRLPPADPRHALVMLLLLLANHAQAGKLMDYIRSYDLNNYALGVAVTSSQSPYIGADNSTYGYPYLSSFRNAAFTDDWLLVNDGDLGVRWIPESKWVLGFVGRINTGGTGNSSAEELQGLSSRQWTVEMGPLVGWRGWPLHLEYKLRAEISHRHDGRRDELTVSWPTEWSWGYLVPYVKLLHQDDDYNDYYYGVSAVEATAARPEYSAGESTNVVVQVRAGYAISERWLLTGSIDSEWLGSAIRSSPLVDENQLWSVNLGLAYNADIFQPRLYEGEPFKMPRFEFRAGVFRNSVDSKIHLESADGGPSQQVDLENRLDADTSGSVLQLDGILRIGLFHRLEFGYFELGRESTAALAQDISIGDEDFTEGTTVELRSTASTARISYGYSLMNDSQKELGISGGLHLTRFEADIFAPDTDQYVRAKVSTPLPVVGLFGSVALGSRAILAARAQVFRMDFDNFEGSLNYLYLGLQVALGEDFGVGLGYNYYRMKLDSSNPGLDGRLELQQQGPLLYLSAHF